MIVSRDLEVVRCSEDRVFAENWSLKLNPHRKRHALKIRRARGDRHAAGTGDVRSHRVLIAQIHGEGIGMRVEPEGWRGYCWAEDDIDLSEESSVFIMDETTYFQCSGVVRVVIASA